MNNRLYYRLLKLASLISLTIIALMLAGEKNAQANSINSLYLAQTPQLPPGSNTDNLPNTPLPDTRERPKIKPVPPIEDFLDTPPSQLPSETIPESEAEFRVKQFKLEGNTVLEPEEVENILKDYRARPVTFAKLLELETKFTQLYTRKGYINSALVIPSQDVSRGTVTLRAIEGRVEEINVNVNGRLKEGYVRSRLGRGTKSPFNIDELQEALQILQLNPLIESL
ncbi:MAG: POTRA domain-containing protein, partial [Waterburya sp.]